jgi:hypothetical protein
MALTEIPSELSSTPSIVDGGNATAITISSSENVLVNRTSVFTTAKMEIQSDAGDASTLSLNSINTDGSILEFYKAGTTVGSIGTVGGRLGIGTGDAGLFFDDNNNKISPVNMASGTPVDSDGLLDLGYSAARYKDLYLSGGAYLGGTAAANKISDYETGAWTPAFSAGSWAGIANFTYTKIGRVVHLTGYLGSPSNLPTSGYLSISGLPFSGNANYNMSQLWYNAATDVDAAGFIAGNQYTLNVRPVNGSISELTELSCNMTYITNE